MPTDQNKVLYGFSKQVKNNLTDLGLEEEQVALDVSTYQEGDKITLDYTFETLEWYEEGVNRDSVTYTDSYSFTPEEDVVPGEEEIKSFLEGNFLDAPLRLNSEVIRRGWSPDYEAF